MFDILAALMTGSMAIGVLLGSAFTAYSIHSRREDDHNA